MKANENTETENTINRKLDALKAAIKQLLALRVRGYERIPENALMLLEDAWKDDPDEGKSDLPLR